MGKSNEVAASTIDVAIAHAARLLSQQPAQAEQSALEILEHHPGEPRARLVLGQARNRLGRHAQALGVLEPLARDEPESAIVHFEAAMAHSLLGQVAPAIAGLTEVTRLRPDWPEAWRQLADHCEAAGDLAAAERARVRFLSSSVDDPKLRSAADALQAGELLVAEPLLRERLSEHPTDVTALRLLAEVATRQRRFQAAQELLEQAIALTPGLASLLHQLAVVLFRQSKIAQAQRIVRALMERDPQNLGVYVLHAGILAHLGETDASLRAYEAVLRQRPQDAQVWMSYGHVLKSAGRTPDCIAALRKATALQPTLGEAYWSLADLKSYRFDESEQSVMKLALIRDDIGAEDRLQLEFAMGKAREDAGDFAASFAHYSRGAGIRRTLQPYRHEDVAAHVRRCREVYTREFLAARSGAGAPAPDPIFILGLPRSGSTLLEQMLGCHTQVEATAELPQVAEYVREIAERGSGDGVRYLDAVREMPPSALRALGERYLAETRVYRKRATPFFVDKMPNNFLHLGLLLLILPHARIIDARRHPLACGFSNFKQHFARGQNYSYSLEDLGAFYRSYVELMEHFDQVLPGRVLRVLHEDVVDDPEAQLRRMLDHCGLPFEDACLRFHESRRSVRTASAEQVRRPINRDGVEQWRNFDPWLGPLRLALGSVLDEYPRVPSELR